MLNPFLPKSSKFSKHVETIEGSMSPPDCTQGLACALRILWCLEPPNLQSFRDIFYGAVHGRVQVLFNFVCEPVESHTGKPRG